MSIHLRKRGEVWHARGTVRVGTEIVRIGQFSTGCHSRADAESVVASKEAGIRREHLEGPKGRQSTLTLNDAFAAYLTRPGGVKDYDADRIRDLSDRIGERRIAEAPDAWAAWLRMRAMKMAPATAARWRAIYRAALGEGCRSLGAGLPPAIPAVKQAKGERLVYLTVRQREALLTAYSGPAGRVALVLAYQGLRTQEALRLEWQHVNLKTGDIRIVTSKSGKGRTVPIHPRVLAMLTALHHVMKEPEIGTVFLSSRGRPYADTRGKGGNPLTKAHASACRKVGLAGFRVHDFRHDWAANCIMSGVDLRTLQKLGGWASLRMVEKYGDVTADHMRDALAKLA